mgnify:CR=1 FL=1
MLGEARNCWTFFALFFDARPLSSGVFRLLPPLHFCGAVGAGFAPVGGGVIRGTALSADFPFAFSDQLLMQFFFARQHRREKPAADQRARDQLRTRAGIKPVQQQAVSVHVVAALLLHHLFHLRRLLRRHSYDLVQAQPPFSF